MFDEALSRMSESPSLVGVVRLRNAFSPTLLRPKNVHIAIHDADGSIEMATHILFESASGYAIFEVKLREEIAAMTEAVQKSIQDLGKFKKMVSLVSFSPFKNAAHALENANDISEGASSSFDPSFDPHAGYRLGQRGLERTPRA